MMPETLFIADLHLAPGRVVPFVCFKTFQEQRLQYNISGVQAIACTFFKTVSLKIQKSLFYAKTRLSHPVKHHKIKF